MAHNNLETDQHSGLHDSGASLNTSKFFADAYTPDTSRIGQDCRGAQGTHESLAGKDAFNGASPLAFDQGQGQAPKLDFAGAKPLQMHGPDIGAAFKKADQLPPRHEGGKSGHSAKKPESYLPDMSETLAAFNVAY